MIECDSVRFGYGKTKDAELIHGISLSIEDGEFVALTGENGAGKSTFSKLLAGILKPSDGKICVNGIDTKKSEKQHACKNHRLSFPESRPPALHLHSPGRNRIRTESFKDWN